jgi:hypothetical protein
MKGWIGVPGSITHIIPRSIHIDMHKLSKEAKQRLKIIQWYNTKSSFYNSNGQKSVVLTCRHFGISKIL